MVRFFISCPRDFVPRRFEKYFILPSLRDYGCTTITRWPYNNIRLDNFVTSRVVLRMGN